MKQKVLTRERVLNGCTILGLVVAGIGLCVAIYFYIHLSGMSNDFVEAMKFIKSIPEDVWVYLGYFGLECFCIGYILGKAKNPEELSNV